MQKLDSKPLVMLNDPKANDLKLPEPNVSFEFRLFLMFFLILLVSGTNILKRRRSKLRQECAFFNFLESSEDESGSEFSKEDIVKARSQAMKSMIEEQKSQRSVRRSSVSSQKAPQKFDNKSRRGMVITP